MVKKIQRIFYTNEAADMNALFHEMLEFVY